MDFYVCLKTMIDHYRPRGDGDSVEAYGMSNISPGRSVSTSLGFNYPKPSHTSTASVSKYS